MLSEERFAEVVEALRKEFQLRGNIYTFSGHIENFVKICVLAWSKQFWGSCWFFWGLKGFVQSYRNLFVSSHSSRVLSRAINGLKPHSLVQTSFLAVFLSCTLSKVVCLVVCVLGEAVWMAELEEEKYQNEDRSPKREKKHKHKKQKKHKRHKEKHRSQDDKVTWWFLIILNLLVYVLLWWGPNEWKSAGLGSRYNGKILTALKITFTITSPAASPFGPTKSGSVNYNMVSYYRW